MKNKILITGLALGNEVGICNVCNFDFDWIIEYPSTLLWADKIIISNNIWDIINNERTLPKKKEFNKSLKLIFDLAKDKGLIEIFNTSKILNKKISNILFSEIERDIKIFPKIYPETAFFKEEEKFTALVINGDEYCIPYLWNIYASLFLSQYFNAECYFNRKIMNYCSYKFGANSVHEEVNLEGIARFQSFHKVFESYFPNNPLFSSYAWENKKKCQECKNEIQCQDTYLIEIEKNLKQIFEWREYDEFFQIRQIINKIIEKKQIEDSIIDPNEVFKDFRSEELIINNKIKNRFPKIQRWANLTTIISIPVALMGLASGNPLITMPGAVIGGIAKSTDEFIKYLTNKYNWVAFLKNLKKETSK